MHPLKSNDFNDASSSPAEINPRVADDSQKSRSKMVKSIIMNYYINIILGSISPVSFQEKNALSAGLPYSLTRYHRQKNGLNTPPDRSLSIINHELKALGC
jgi:hypothetical protein